MTESSCPPHSAYKGRPAGSVGQESRNLALIANARLAGDQRTVLEQNQCRKSMHLKVRSQIGMLINIDLHKFGIVVAGAADNIVKNATLLLAGATPICIKIDQYHSWRLIDQAMQIAIGIEIDH